MIKNQTKTNIIDCSVTFLKGLWMYQGIEYLKTIDIDKLTIKDIFDERLYMKYVICDECKVWTPIFCMSPDSLYYN